MSPADVDQLLQYQAKSIAALRASNQSLVAFQEYSSRSFDQISGVHAQRVAKIERLRVSLTDIFVRIRQLRMQLHVRTPGLGPYVEDEDAEQREIEQLKRTIAEEEAALEEVELNRTLNSLPTSPAGMHAGKDDTGTTPAATPVTPMSTNTPVPVAASAAVSPPPTAESVGR